MCQCLATNSPDKICKHLVYFFCYHLKIDINYIPFIMISDIREYISNNMFILEDFYTKCDEYLDENECGICLEKLNTINNNQLYQYSCCNCLAHYKCLCKWVSSNKNNENRCIYCNSIFE